MSSSSSSSSSSNAPKVTPAGKKRNRDPLSDQMHERRYAEVSQTEDYWLDLVAVPVTNEKIVAAHKHAMLAVSYQRQCDENFDENVVRRVNIDFDVSLEAAHYDGYLKDRRNAIKYVFFAGHGGPPEAEWHRSKIIASISYLLNIPATAHMVVRNVLQSVAKNPEQYDGAIAAGGGRDTS